MTSPRKREALDLTRAADSIAPAVERLLMSLVRRRFGEMEPSPLTTTQQIALAIVVDDGPLRLRALARRIGTTAATATRSTDALEAHGLVVRQADPSDGRGVLVCATRTGRSVRRESHWQLVVLLERLLEQLSPDDRQRFVALMSDLYDLVDASERRANARTARTGSALRQSLA
jgi:DNA-binding MarR family transcriptional regulator